MKHIYFDTKLKDIYLVFMINIKIFFLKPFSFPDFKLTGHTSFTEFLQQTTCTKAILIDEENYFPLQK